MATPKVMRQLTRTEVAKHHHAGDLWVIIDSKVYDLSRFASLHPGGLSVLLDEEVAGKDATDIFYQLHRDEVLEKYARLQIGYIKGENPQITALVPGALSAVPYGEPTWLSPGFSSPYYKETHRQLQKAMRKFVDEILYPEGQMFEETGKRPSNEALKAMADMNIHAMRLGPGKHLHGLELMGGIVKPEEFDYFHELVVTQEMTRVGVRGYGDGLLSGSVIGLPPVLNFGSEALKKRIVPEVFQAQKFICLAISEPFAGSDVSGMRTTAVKSEDGKYWIVNGTKKWITNGTFCDYFTTGCRTDGGFTVILIERGPGVETIPIKTAYSPAAGTAYVTFDNVKVPVENTLGEEDLGLMVILSNFNHERWVMCCASARAQRLVMEECVKWANQRNAFGKPLIAQPIVRSKLASMISRVEAAQSWLENLTHQMNNMSYNQQSEKLAGQIAFLKPFCTRSAQQTAEDAVQIFGGRGITRTGMGRFIEHYHRTITFDSLLGGAEDVLFDLGARQAARNIPEGVRL